MEALRRQLAEAERRAAPSTVVSEANASALALYRQGPRPITFRSLAGLVQSHFVRSLDSSNHIRPFAGLVQSHSFARSFIPCNLLVGRGA